MAQFTFFKGVSIAVAQEEGNPLLRKLRFILTDYKPNVNNMVVPKEEAAKIAETARFMPVKINFDEGEPGGHAEADVIGVIQEAEVLEDHVVAEAYIWENEHKDVVEWLDYCEKNDVPVHFSWELFYDEAKSSVVDGITYLRDVILKAVAIVKNPAYRGRTTMIAFSELKEQEEGGTISMEDKHTETVEQLKAELEELRKFKQEVERQKAIEAKRLLIAEAFNKSGLSQLFNESRLYFAENLSEEQLSFYIEDLKNIVAAFSSKEEKQQPEQKEAQSESLRYLNVPNPIVSQSVSLDPKSVAQYIRQHLNK